jgi:PhnB protein
MTYYRDVMGGDLDVMGLADVPPGEMPTDGLDPDFVMHAALVFPGGNMLMASDDPTGDGGPAKGLALHFTASTIDDGERIFGALTDGGSVEMPFAEVFWALRFGTCVDRYGTSWMISVDHPESMP